MEGHPPFPYGENLERMSKVDGQVVEEDVTDPAPQDYPHCHGNNKISHIIMGPPYSPAFYPRKYQEIGSDEADDVHEAVPAEFHRTKAEKNRIDMRHYHVKPSL